MILKTPLGEAEILDSPYYSLTSGDESPYFDEDMAVIHLLALGELFISTQGETIQLVLNCNDVFAWGCADAENVPPNTIQELWDSIAKTGSSTLWVCQRRNERPQPALEAYLRKLGRWTEEYEALPPNQLDAQITAFLREAEKKNG